jgi:hypothetical protein
MKEETSEIICAIAGIVIMVACVVFFFIMLISGK